MPLVRSCSFKALLAPASKDLALLSPSMMLVLEMLWFETFDYK